MDVPVQYITEDFLKRKTKTGNLSSLTSLCLSGHNLSPYKVKYIEHLNTLKHLTCLNLSANVITKIDGLQSLLNLKSLDLQDNLISRLEGLENLSKLQYLNLKKNLITGFPNWFQKKMVCLTVFDISDNRIDTIHQFTKLRSLLNLTKLNLAGNPAISEEKMNDIFEHNVKETFDMNETNSDNAYRQLCRAFIIFHLRSLTLLDGSIVELEDHQRADSWFEQVEISRINQQLQTREAEVAQLTDAMQRLVAVSENRILATDTLYRENAEQDRRLLDMQKELAAKDELLQAKSKELLRACLKHFEIEQELAFYRIDSKLAGLNRPPEIDGCGIVNEDDLESVHESPYVGKCRYIRVPNSPLGALATPGRPNSSLTLRSSCSPEPMKSSDLAQGPANSASQANSLCMKSKLNRRLKSDDVNSPSEHSHSSLEKACILQNSNRLPLRKDPLTLACDVSTPEHRPTITMPYFGESPDWDEFLELPHIPLSNLMEPDVDSLPNATNQKLLSGNLPTPINSASRSRISARLLDSGLETANGTLRTNHSTNEDNEKYANFPDASSADVEIDSFSSHHDALNGANHSDELQETDIKVINDGVQNSADFIRRHKNASAWMESTNRSTNRIDFNESLMRQRQSELRHRDGTESGSSFTSEAANAKSFRRKSVKAQTERTSSTDMSFDRPMNPSEQANFDEIGRGLINLLSASQPIGGSDIRRMRMNIRQLQSAVDLSEHIGLSTRRHCVPLSKKSESDSAACLQSPNDFSPGPSDHFPGFDGQQSSTTSPQHLMSPTKPLQDSGFKKPPRETRRNRRSSSRPQADALRIGNRRSLTDVDSAEGGVATASTDYTDSGDNSFVYSSRRHSKSACQNLQKSDESPKTRRPSSLYSRSQHNVNEQREKAARRQRPHRRSSIDSADYSHDKFQTGTHHQKAKRRLRSTTNDRDITTPLDVKLLFNLQDELCDLHRQFQATEDANSRRLQQAIHHISQLETELRQRKPSTPNIVKSDQSESVQNKWVTQLTAGLDELKRCQLSIHQLQASLEEKEQVVERREHHSSMSSEQDRQLGDIRNSLRQQEQQLTKLNEMVNRLLTIPSVVGKAEELEHVTTGLSTLHQSINAERRPLDAQDSQRVYGTSEVTELTRLLPATGLCCNVSEHHNLEDYLQQLQTATEQLEGKVQRQKKKLKHLKAANAELGSVIRARDEELSKITQELLRAKEELLAANSRVKTIFAEHLQNVSAEKTEAALLNAEMQKLELRSLEKRKELDSLLEQAADVNAELAKLKIQLTSCEEQKLKYGSELKDLLTHITEKQDCLKELGEKFAEASHKLTRAQDDLSLLENQRQSNLQVISQSDLHISGRRCELEQLQAQILEAKVKLERLSHELGAKSAELEILTAKSHHDLANAATKLEAVNQEFEGKQTIVDKLTRNLEALKLEKSKLTSEVDALRRLDTTASPTTNENAAENSSSAQLSQLKVDKARQEEELRQLEFEKNCSMAELSQLQASIVREQKCLESVTAQCVATETERTGIQSQCDILQSQLTQLETNVNLKQKVLSELCANSDAKLASLNKEITKLSMSTKQLSDQRTTAESDLSEVQRELNRRSVDLVDVNDRVLSAERELERTEALLSDRQQLSLELSEEVKQISQSLEGSRTYSVCADEERQAVESELGRVSVKLAKSKAYLKNLEEKVLAKRSESKRLSSEIQDRYDELARLESACLSQSTDLLNEKIVRQKLQELESALSSKDVEIMRLTEQFHSFDRGAGQSEMAQELERLRTQLTAAHRVCKKIKRRTARELAQLERVAEEQCNRAGFLSEELDTLRRNHTYLQARITTYGTLMDEVFTVAAAEEVADREERLQAALAAVKLELKTCTSAEGKTALQHFNDLEAIVTRRTRSPFNTSLQSPELIPDRSMWFPSVAKSSNNLIELPPRSGRAEQPINPTAALAEIAAPVANQIRKPSAQARRMENTTASFSPSSGIASSLGQMTVQLSTPREERFSIIEEKLKHQLSGQPEGVGLNWSHSRTVFEDIHDEMQQLRQQIETVGNASQT